MKIPRCLFYFSEDRKRICLKILPGRFTIENINMRSYQGWDYPTPEITLPNI